MNQDTNKKSPSRLLFLVVLCVCTLFVYFGVSHMMCNIIHSKINKYIEQWKNTGVIVTLPRVSINGIFPIFNVALHNFDIQFLNPSAGNAVKFSNVNLSLNLFNKTIYVNKPFSTITSLPMIPGQSTPQPAECKFNIEDQMLFKMHSFSQISNPIRSFEYKNGSISCTSANHHSGTIYVNTHIDSFDTSSMWKDIKWQMSASASKTYKGDGISMKINSSPSGNRMSIITLEDARIQINNMILRGSGTGSVLFDSNGTPEMPKGALSLSLMNYNAFLHLLETMGAQGKMLSSIIKISGKKIDNQVMEFTIDNSQSSEAVSVNGKSIIEIIGSANMQSANDNK